MPRINKGELPKNQEFSYEIKIPEERVAVLIGEEGKVKKEIEAETKTHIDITTEGDVTIEGEDALLRYTAREIVRAVARGFNPKIALLLNKTDYTLEIIDMKDIAGKSNCRRSCGSFFYNIGIRFC